MKYMKSLVIVLVVLLAGGIFSISPTSCNGNSQPGTDITEDDTLVYKDIEEDIEEEESVIDSEYHWEPPIIPTFVKRLFSGADWSADTICVVDGKAYYMAYDDNGRTNVLYNKDRILVADPTLSILPYDKDKHLYHASVIGKDILVDFSDDKSLQGLSKLTVSLPDFTTTYYNASADFCERVHYSISVDFPRRSIAHSDAITKWLVEKIADSEDMNGELPPLNAFYINYAKRTNVGWRYDGDIHNHKRICKFASEVYFAFVKSDYSMNEMDIPSSLFSALCLKSYVKNNRFVTYQQFTHGYYGGAHGYYTERLISYDHVHGQEVDYKYLFKDGNMKDIVDLLKEEAKKSPNYQIWEPNIDEYACVKDENDKPTGLLRLPQPGLSDEGVVFSFQPYEISCFAAGAFHFTIPYDKLRPYMTDAAKWCLNMN